MKLIIYSKEKTNHQQHDSKEVTKRINGVLGMKIRSISTLNPDLAPGLPLRRYRRRCRLPPRNENLEHLNPIPSSPSPPLPSLSPCAHPPARTPPPPARPRCLLTQRHPCWLCPRCEHVVHPFPHATPSILEVAWRVAPRHVVGWMMTPMRMPPP